MYEGIQCREDKCRFVRSRNLRQTSPLSTLSSPFRGMRLPAVE